MPRSFFLQTASFAFAFAMSVGAAATELGEPKVVSYIGQQLVADIELTALEDPGSAVQAKLASPDVYQGANVDMPPVLASLNMNVMRRDGKQFLHLTSLKPVEADHLHLYFELIEGGRRSVRLATLWFTPDPTPAPPPVKVAPLPVAAAETAPPPAAQEVRQPPPAPKPMPQRAPEPRPAQQALPLKAPTPHPAPVHLAEAPAAPSCKPQPVPVLQQQPDPVCAALDEKNADLRAQVTKLEERVKTLQESKAKPVPVKATAGQGTLRPMVQPQQRMAAIQAPPPGLPWDWIGGAGAGVFMLVGAVQFWRTKRARAKAILEAKATMKARATPLPREPVADSILG